MGGGLSKAFGRKKKGRVLILGLDAAGKTTILMHMKHGVAKEVVTTVGFNVESFKVGGVKFTCWDVGGQEKTRQLWRYYFQGTQGLVFVVDSTDVERMGIAAEELKYLLEHDELKGASLLVLANKQDKPDATRVPEIQRLLGLDSVKFRKFRIAGVSGMTGDGLDESFTWLAENMPS
eukprot:c11168_g1_i2.p1 GENE.c11168_g1_i2~~c11168_g1_i2.p1  ORF type:complete len:177 (+),score=66.36 c11168_g1_i2:95-625(+)